MRLLELDQLDYVGGHALRLVLKVGDGGKGLDDGDGLRAEFAV